ncbi:MAG: lysozyme inhibitor LprI family protein [Candidatus Adiutrix sp.]|jgi:uncharacterized protein YecT (DUF1311 family)|nr:lysozyme inhibitor LprI family protein [Candidatus Adiutrix sp.]
MKKLLLLSVMLLAMPSGALFAQDAGDALSAECGQCLENSGGVTSAMIGCLQTEYDKQDARLNAAYKQVRGQISGGQAKKLQTAQRAWLQYRDAYQDYFNDPDGGSMARVEAIDWLARSTAAQAKILESIVPF